MVILGFSQWITLFKLVWEVFSINNKKVLIVPKIVRNYFIRDIMATIVIPIRHKTSKIKKRSIWINDDKFEILGMSQSQKLPWLFKRCPSWIETKLWWIIIFWRMRHILWYTGSVTKLSGHVTTWHFGSLCLTRPKGNVFFLGVLYLGWKLNQKV